MASIKHDPIFPPQIYEEWDVSEREDTAGIIERLGAVAPETDIRAIEDDIHKLLPEPKTIVPPHYCSSIDAALSLVPEGWRWKLGYSKHVPCVAELVDYTPKAIGATCGECDSNHAIALCIAALRARQHGGDQHWTALRANKGEG